MQNIYFTSENLLNIYDLGLDYEFLVFINEKFRICIEIYENVLFQNRLFLTSVSKNYVKYKLSYRF